MKKNRRCEASSPIQPNPASALAPMFRPPRQPRTSARTQTSGAAPKRTGPDRPPIAALPSAVKRREGHREQTPTGSSRILRPEGPAARSRERLRSRCWPSTAGSMSRFAMCATPPVPRARGSLSGCSGGTRAARREAIASRPPRKREASRRRTPPGSLPGGMRADEGRSRATKPGSRPPGRRATTRAVADRAERPHSRRHRPARAQRAPAAAIRRSRRDPVLTTRIARSDSVAACQIRYPIPRIAPPALGMNTRAGIARAVQSAAAVFSVTRFSAPYRAASAPTAERPPARTRSRSSTRRVERTRRGRRE